MNAVNKEKTMSAAISASKHPVCPSCGRKLVARIVQCPECQGKGIRWLLGPPCDNCKATGWIYSVDKSCSACAEKPKRKNGKKNGKKK